MTCPPAAYLVRHAPWAALQGRTNKHLNGNMLGRDLVVGMVYRCLVARPCHCLEPMWFCGQWLWLWSLKNTAWEFVESSCQWLCQLMLLLRPEWGFCSSSAAPEPDKRVASDQRSSSPRFQTPENRASPPSSLLHHLADIYLKPKRNREVHQSSKLVSFRSSGTYFQLTSQIWSSVCSSRGSRLLRMDPWNMVGSCGMMLSLERRSWSPIREMSTPSIRIFPAVGSTIRNRVWIKVDLPLPVLPTIPVFFPPQKVQLRPRSTTGKWGAYRN